jgi:hypothetical protein
MIHDSCFEIWVVECDVELKVESNDVLQFWVWCFCFFGSCPLPTSMQFKCKLVEGSPNHVLSSLHTLSKLAFSLCVHVFNLHSTCHKFVNQRKRLKMPLNVAIIIFLRWFVYVLWVLLTSFAIVVMISMYEGLVHYEHEMLN